MTTRERKCSFALDALLSERVGMQLPVLHARAHAITAFAPGGTAPPGEHFMDH